jgi:hypothetical protein
MANTIDWGKATQNNTNGFGKYQNTINAGDIYEDSWAGETALIGTSAAFSYSKSSYHQGEADPTPTITGTTGGSFVCTSGAIFVDTGSTSSSTGQIDLDASTIDTHLISYTVDGVTATANVGITASPFLANTYSMDFDGTNYVNASSLSSTLQSLTNGTISMWWKPIDHTPSTSNCLFSVASTTVTNEYFAMYNLDNGKLYAQLKDNGFNYWVLQTDAIAFATNTWTHIAITHNGTEPELYINGSKPSQSFVSELDKVKWWDDISIQKVNIGALIWSGGTSGNASGKIDEVAIWNTALSSDAVQEIYNATNNNTGKALDLSTDYNNYTSSSNLQYWTRLGD